MLASQASARHALSHVVPHDSRARALFTPDALGFLSRLVARFEASRRELLEQRIQRQARFDEGALPDFAPETQHVRDGEWRVPTIPADLIERRVRILGPADRTALLDALTAGGRVVVADFEDGTSPTWPNIVDAHVNLRDGAREATGAIVVRPRGMHASEGHVRWGGQPIGGCLFDFGMYLFQSARARIERGSGPYFSLAKLEHSLEARWWGHVIDAAEDLLQLPRGTVKITVRIETLPAVFQMEELLYELREHAVAMRSAHDNGIASYIKTLRAHRDRVLPDREVIAMDDGFLGASSRRILAVCARRGAFGLEGGLSAEPSPDRNALLAPIKGAITERGVRASVGTALRTIAAWLVGQGAVQLDARVDNASNAEVARMQLWQWIRHGSALADGTRVTRELVNDFITEACEALRSSIAQDAYARSRTDDAARLLVHLIDAETPIAHFADVAYDRI